MWYEQEPCDTDLWPMNSEIYSFHPQAWMKVYVKSEENLYKHAEDTRIGKK